MGARKLAAALAIAISGASASDALLLKDFDALDDTAASEYVANVLSRIFDYYNAKSERRHRAQCMADFYESTDAYGKSRLIDAVTLEMQLVRNKEMLDVKVEDIVYGVIEHECNPERGGGT
ncbi:MAG: hypothetical protein H6954_05190 [Chromatiaceae bacterium]|nr:hypothetical protein [Chromatiaceae bacterium]